MGSAPQKYIGWATRLFCILVEVDFLGYAVIIFHVEARGFICVIGWTILDTEELSAGSRTNRDILDEGPLFV